MIYIIAAILIFGVLIAVHELGHFLSGSAFCVCARINVSSPVSSSVMVLSRKVISFT